MSWLFLLRVTDRIASLRIDYLYGNSLLALLFFFFLSTSALLKNSKFMYSHLYSKAFVSFMKRISLDFRSGAVDKNLPANAGDMGSIPGPGRLQMLWSSKTQEPRWWKPTHSRAGETQLLSLCANTPAVHVPGEPHTETTDPARSN